MTTTHSIDFPERECTFLGRNGVFKQHGLMIYSTLDKVEFYPVTSKGDVGRATVTIPREMIPEVMKALSDIMLKVAVEST